ncbi:MAG TPA: xanthine dehydrogenase family protein subunit M [Acidimicrobiales bacterium]|jgi:carbon-monoxide dehydrogenase medium subunit|nr:xanthine dehydrogenase family protein subunit M [Acidimicrobiales bacterium]
MFPSDFEYLAPTSLEEALAALAERPDDAKVLAGGQSLIPLMKLRFAAPALIVDINRIPGLDTLAEEGGALRVGALVRNRTLERSDLVSSRYPTMAAAAPMISDPVVRNQGTFVGSLCHADPQGDWGSVMLALDGSVVARSQAGGERSIPIGEFLDGPFTCTLRPDELAVEARIPDPGPEFAGTYLKLERKIGDFATVGVAVFLATDGGTVTRAGIGLTGVGATNIKATAAEAALVGNVVSDDLIDEAARLAAEAADPRTDVRGSAEYKRDVVRVYVARGLRSVAAAPVA